MGKYRFLTRISARASLAYWGDVAASTFFLATILFIFSRLWHLTFIASGSTTLADLTESQLVWYLGATEVLTMSRPRVAPEVDADVRTGALAVHLLRPLSYPLYRLATHLGERLLRLTLYAAVAFLVCAAVTRSVPISLSALVLFGLSLPLALLLDFLAHFAIGLGAFWMEDTQGLTLIYTRLQMLLGGTLLPLSLFPGWLQKVTAVLPFSAMIYGPSRLLVDPGWALFAEVLLRQTLAAGVLSAGVAGIFRLAIRRVEVQGG